MTKQLTRHSLPEPPSPDLIEKVLLAGDLSELTPEQRLNYYRSVCETLGLNPLTKPFDYIVLEGRLQLYARKDCTEQLRRQYGISLNITSRQQNGSVYSVTAQARLPSGRVDESIGAVPTQTWRENGLHDLMPIAIANAMMKAETKAKRRVTLSICGLGMLDESELDQVFDQPQEPDAITERNVREATSNATGEPVELPEVTKDNWRDVICHIGKAEGEILQHKVGEIRRPLIKWLAENWIPKLPAIPSDKDRRLRDAVLFAVAEGEPKGNAVELATELIQRAEDLILTPDQLVEFLRNQGLLAQDETLTDMPVERLQYLLGDGWRKLKEIHEAAVKPKILPDKKKPAAQRRKKKQEGHPFS